MDGQGGSGLGPSVSRAAVLTAFVAGIFVAAAPAVAQVAGSPVAANREAPNAASARGNHATVTADDRSPAWSAALSHYGEQRIRNAYDLASRGAIHTAQHELFEVLRAVAQTLDADQGTTRHSQALISAKAALEEAEDFLKAGLPGPRPRSVAEIAASHQTPLLHEGRSRSAPSRPVTPVVALQLYYSDAVRQFALAAGHQPVASEVLFALGRVVSLLRERHSAGDRAAVPLVEQKMLLFYRAAWTVDPRNHRARNEYGVLLARFNQWPQACRAFEYSVAQQPEVQNTRNLAVAYEHLGERELAAQARQLSRSLSSDSRDDAAAPSGQAAFHVAPAVEWVDLETFNQRGTPAGWSTLAPNDVSGSPAGTGTAGSPRNSQAAGPERTTAESAQTPPGGKRRRLDPARGFDRLKSVFTRK